MEAKLLTVLMRVALMSYRAREKSMGLWKHTRTSTGIERVEIDVKELQLRLQTIARQANIEVVQLALQSMLDEIEDSQYQLKLRK